MITISYADNGGKAEARVGESFEVQLPENPTTGYRWQLHLPVGPVLEVAEDSFAGSQGAYGIGGLRCWRFRALQEGAFLLEIEHRRSWETEPVDMFKVTVKVKAR
jgi:inhibitor of cysteine peptidase